MQAKTISANGREFASTTVRIPLALREMATKHHISMSALLTVALEQKYEEIKENQNFLRRDK